MISRIEGTLVEVGEGSIELRCGEITYTLLVPAADLPRLAACRGETVELHTLHYLEMQGQGTSATPRLIGFADPDDRAFFELFTTVKGLGNRKALRALQLPFARVAEAIASRNTGLLVSLPEIGRRTAEAIVVELDGKVDRFIEMKPVEHGGGSAPPGLLEARREAVAGLIALGESRLVAEQLVERAIRADPTIDTAARLVPVALSLREAR
jgi:Holliday junction DNA helicase RuvA